MVEAIRAAREDLGPTASAQARLAGMGVAYALASAARPALFRVDARGRSATRGAAAQALDRRGDRVVGQPLTAITTEAVTGEGQVKVVLSQLDQLLPDADRHDDGLGTAVGVEIDRLGLPGVEASGDAM